MPEKKDKKRKKKTAVKKQPCPSCDGKGYLPKTGLTCATCFGRGWIRW